MITNSLKSHSQCLKEKRQAKLQTLQLYCPASPPPRGLSHKLLCQYWFVSLPPREFFRKVLCQYCFASPTLRGFSHRVLCQSRFCPDRLVVADSEAGAAWLPVMAPGRPSCLAVISWPHLVSRVPGAWHQAQLQRWCLDLHYLPCPNNVEWREYKLISSQYESDGVTFISEIR